MKITKEQIKKAYQDKEYLKELFPSVFEEKLEVGKWYKYDSGAIFFAKNEFKDDSTIGYGFIGEKKDWSDFFHYYKCSDYMLKLATKEEVETALIAEAKKRGFKENVYYSAEKLGFESQKRMLIERNDFYYDYNENKLLIDEWRIFKDGIWGEVIEETKTIEVTLQQIAEKFNVDNVKIIKS